MSGITCRGEMVVPEVDLCVEPSSIVTVTCIVASVSAASAMNSVESKRVKYVNWDGVPDMVSRVLYPPSATVKISNLTVLMMHASGVAPQSVWEMSRVVWKSTDVPVATDDGAVMASDASETSAFSTSSGDST